MHRLAIESDEPRTADPRIGWRSTLVALLGPRGMVATVVAGAILGLSLLIVGGLPQRVQAWVHERPEFLWSVDRIELDPAPPPWLRSGADEVRDAVRNSLRSFDGGSALDLDLGAVERAFKQVVWIDQVLSVRRVYPDRVIVSVEYRKPVAIAQLDPGDSTSESKPADLLLVDGTGSILDRVPIKSERGAYFASELIKLSGLSWPARVEFGRAWPRSDNPQEADPAAVSSARLARFLLDRASEEGWPETRTGQRVRTRGIHPFRGDPSNLYLSQELPDSKTLWVVWGAEPGEERTEEPSAEEKWSMLRNWFASGGADRPLEDGALGFKTRGPVWLPELR